MRIVRDDLTHPDVIALLEFHLRSAFEEFAARKRLRARPDGVARSGGHPVVGLGRRGPPRPRRAEAPGCGAWRAEIDAHRAGASAQRRSGGDARPPDRGGQGAGVQSAEPGDREQRSSSRRPGHCTSARASRRADRSRTMSIRISAAIIGWTSEGSLPRATPMHFCCCSAPTIWAGRTSSSRAMMANGWPNQHCPIPIEGVRSLAWRSDRDGREPKYGRSCTIHASKGRRAW